MPDASFAQQTYQVRFEWGADGLARLAPSDVVIVVDVLRFSSRVIESLEAGEPTRSNAVADAGNGARVADAAAETGSLVLLGALRNAAAVARAVLATQTERAQRTSVAIIAAGERDRDGDAPLRFAVEDLLGAGAVIAALTDLGIDHSSPEAAVAAESFRSLKGASRHLLTASGTGRSLDARGRRDEVLAAAAIDVASVVPVLRDGSFVAF